MNVAANQTPKSAERFSDRLSRLIKECGGSQSWLAEVTEVRRSTVSRWVKGERTPSPELLERIAVALNCPVAALVEGTDAEDRLDTARKVVATDTYTKVLAQLAQAERERDEALEDAEREERRRVEVERAQGEVYRRIENSQADLNRALAAKRDLEGDLKAEKARSAALMERLQLHERALAKAAACIEELRGQIVDLSQEIKEAGKSMRRASIIAGVAGGAVTVATLLSWARNNEREGPTPESEDES